MDATLTGTIDAANVDIATEGAHCAALATDRGNGTVIVSGGIMTTAGQGSPGIYSTGDIKVFDAAITATGSEAAVMLTDTDTTLGNIHDHGFTIYYDTSLPANKWLDGKTYTLTAGGKLTPKK